MNINNSLIGSLPEELREDILLLMNERDIITLSLVNRKSHKEHRSSNFWESKIYRPLINIQFGDLYFPDLGNEGFDLKTRARVSFIPLCINNFYFRNTIDTLMKGIFAIQIVLVTTEFLYSIDERQDLEHITFWVTSHVKYGTLFFGPFFPIINEHDKVCNFIDKWNRKIKYIKDTADVPDQTIPACHLRVLKLGFRMINKASRLFHKYASMFE